LSVCLSVFYMLAALVANKCIHNVCDENVMDFFHRKTEHTAGSSSE